ncbi:MAG: hypothetical protein AAGI15_15920 [Pseudomonadota bacterium]
MSVEHYLHGAIEFDARGRVSNAAALAAFSDELGGGTQGELLVLSHGWNNDRETARELYDALCASLTQAATQAGDARLQEDLAVLIVHWPSRAFDFDFGTQAAASAGGAAQAGGPVAEPTPQQTLQTALSNLEALCDSDAERAQLARARELTAQLPDLRSAQDAFVATLLPLVTDGDGQAEAGDALPPGAERLAGRDVLDRLGRPLPPGFARGESLAGGAAGLSEALGAIGRGAANLLNLLTFWRMKRRAGVIGRDGLAPALDRLQQARQAAERPLALHLCGHSFGARLLSAATAHRSARTRTLTLLQGAFSHHGFSNRLANDRIGAFRPVIDEGKVTGPILVTHTRNDRAVGLAYPLASRLSRDDASALGGPRDRFGGIGSNGAVRTAEADALSLLAPGERYALGAGRIHNLRADAHISDHSDVTGLAVGHLLHSALRHR